MPPLSIENSNSSSSSSSSLATEENEKIGAKDGKMSDEAMEGDGYNLRKDSIPYAVPISDSDSSDSDLDSRSFSEEDENDDAREERKVSTTTSQLPPRDEAFEQDNHPNDESDSDSSDSDFDPEDNFYDFDSEIDDDIDAFLQDCSNTTTTTTTTTTTPQHHPHQEQEYQQQHYHPQHQQLQQHRPHNRRLRQHYRQDSPHHYRRQPYLDTIAERKVSFAGKVVRMGGSQRYIFVDAVRVKAIPHKVDLPKKKIWYTPEEMKAIRKSCESRAAIVARHHTELYCRIAFRGLEPFIEPLIRELKEQQQQQQHSSETNTVVWSKRHALPRSSVSVVRNRAEPTTTRSEDDDPDSLFSYGHRHWDAIQAVLHEQAKQRWANAFVTNHQHEERSPERIRDAYKAVTQDSAAVALATASRDEIHARELDAGDGGMGRGSNEPYYYHDNDDDDDLPPKKQQQPPCPNNNAWSSLVLSALARALVAPLLDSLVEVREGDIYVRVE